MENMLTAVKQNEARELIKRDRNHPSIVLWSCVLNGVGISKECVENMSARVKEEFFATQMITTGEQ